MVRTRHLSCIALKLASVGKTVISYNFDIVQGNKFRERLFVIRLLNVK